MAEWGPPGDQKALDAVLACVEDRNADAGMMGEQSEYDADIKEYGVDDVKRFREALKNEDQSMASLCQMKIIASDLAEKCRKGNAILSSPADDFARLAKSEAWEKAAQLAESKQTTWWEAEARIVQSDAGWVVVAWSNGQLHAYRPDIGGTR